jgi:hypothetical protein
MTHVRRGPKAIERRRAAADERAINGRGLRDDFAQLRELWRRGHGSCQEALNLRDRLGPEADGPEGPH